jgi:hypothetical protein
MDDELDPRARELVDRLGLRPHPEGGWYAEVWRSAASVGTGDARGSRSALTGIYFLLGRGGVSQWHVVASDEIWCHLEGAPIALFQFDVATRQVSRQPLGPVGETLRPQATVPAGVWQGARCEGDYALAACFVAPGFDFADFRLLTPDDEARLGLRRDDLLKPTPGGA